MDVANDKAQSQLQADVDRNYSPEDFHLPKGPKELDRNSLTLRYVPTMITNGQGRN